MKKVSAVIMVFLIVVSAFSVLSRIASSQSGFGVIPKSNENSIYPTVSGGGSADSWSMFRHDLTHTGYSMSTAPNTNQTLWNYTTSVRAVYSSPAVADGKVFIGSEDGKVYAFGASSNSLSVRIDGHTISLGSNNTVEAVLNVTMLSRDVSSTDVACSLVLLDATGKEVYDNFAGIGGSPDSKVRTIANGTVTSVGFTFQLEKSRPGKYAYSVSVWSVDKQETYDSTDWLPAFDIHLWPVWLQDLGSLHADSYLADEPLILLQRYESINYTFRLVDSVTDLSVKVFTLPDSEFQCTLNATNGQMSLHGELIPHFNVWHNVPSNTYMMNLEMESKIANVIRVVIQAGPSAEPSSVKVVGAEPTGEFATPGGSMQYKVDVKFNATNYDALNLTASLNGQIQGRFTYAVEPFKSNSLTAYLQVAAPSETGQYTVHFNASLIDLRIFDDSASASLKVDYANYNITVAPTVKYYQDRLRARFWEHGHIYVDDPAKLSALDVTNVKICSIDKRDPETGKPSLVSISFDASDKEKDVHYAVYVDFGSNKYLLGALVGGDKAKPMQVHNVPVIDGGVSFTILYQRWFFGNWIAEVGTKVAKAAIDVYADRIFPPGVWFAAGTAAMEFAKYVMLYTEQMWLDQEQAYMTIDDASRIIEDSGVQQNVFSAYLESAEGVTHNPYHAFYSTVEFLYGTQAINDWKIAKIFIAAVSHILERAAERLPQIMTNAIEWAGAEVGITVLTGAVVLEVLHQSLKPVCFLKGLGCLIDSVKAVCSILKILVSPSEEGKEIVNAQIGSGPAVTVDPVISMCFGGQVDYTNDTSFGDMLNLDVKINQTRAQAIFEVDENLTALYLTLLSSSVFRSGMLSDLGFNATKTDLVWYQGNHTFTLTGEGSIYPGITKLDFHMNSTYVEGTEMISSEAQVVDGHAWLNGTLLYQFGKNLNYRINVTIPKGSQIIQVLSNESFSTQNYTVIWNTPVDEMAIEFVPPNIALSDISLSKTVVGQGSNISLNVTVFNNSTCLQTVNVTAFADSTGISSYLFVLDAKAGATATLVWNTAGIAKGNYSISAYAEPVSGEMKTDDNTLTTNRIFVTVVGDINGDKTVNVLDLILIATHLGTIGGGGYEPYSLEWYQCMNTDLNNDGRHNVLDLIICANHLGQHW